ncbi:MAG: hypothetical protein JSV52_03365 [Candidatus Zixiibacteriota bacterium]|nr:MAG: hypothetical protein JSV52_03365 [candidate division Zixibacteria bacterium]
MFSTSTKVTVGILLPILLFALRADSAFGQSDSLISRTLLIEDVRQLAGILEDTHPDPYIRGGGKIAFQRRIWHALEAIPEEGMTRDEFYYVLSPIIASVKDAHTKIHDPYFSSGKYNPYAPGGLPLYFDIIEQSLYVMAVADSSHKDLIGARLVSVEGVPFKKLFERQRKVKGFENVYDVLSSLGKTGTLWLGHLLGDLVPEWNDRTKIRTQLALPDGTEKEFPIDVPQQMNYAGFVYPESIEFPQLEAAIQKRDFEYTFLDSNRVSALLFIADMMGYREAFEIWQALGITTHDEKARAVYKKFHGADSPADINEVIAGIPSCSDVFRTLVEDMKKAGTKNLLIDLRYNSGGNSFMYNILIYYLYGREALLSLKGKSLEIRKFSDHYMEAYGPAGLDEANQDRAIPLSGHDYDFGADNPHRGYPPRDSIVAGFEDFASKAPTFFAEYQSGEYDGYYLPENVIVLCSPATFSSAFFMMHYLHEAGAKILGRPSAQAGNCFGDLINYQLKHSGLSGWVSHKYFELYPDEPETGEVLMPEYEMTYEKLASYNFDTNAEIMWALEILGAKLGDSD